MPNPLNLPAGCLFKRRCPYAMPICDTPPPLRRSGRGSSRCWLTPQGGPPAVGPDATGDVAAQARCGRCRCPRERAERRRRCRPSTARRAAAGRHVGDGAGRASDRRDRPRPGQTTSVKHFPIRGGIAGRQPDRRRARRGRRLSFDDPARARPSAWSASRAAARRRSARSSCASSRRPAAQVYIDKRPLFDLNDVELKAARRRPPDRLPGLVCQPQPAA